MIAKLTVSLILLPAVAAFAPSAAANPFGAGDCQKSGLCVGGCVDLTTPCPHGELACVGVSYQVPQGVTSPDEVSTGDAGLRCLGLPCDVINAVCWVALHTQCVG